MTTTYSYNYDILCAACNKPRYFGYTDLPDSKMCCCHGQDKIPTYDRRLGELSDEALLYASEEDWAFYKKIADVLPTMAGKNNDGKDKFGEYIPYHSGGHILRHFRDTIEIVKPKSIFEIGFNMGHSASMWLELCDAFVFSCDISKKDETLEGAKLIWANNPSRFFYMNREDNRFESAIKSWQFNLCFIDGGHEEENVTADIELCKQLKIPYILFDDYYERFGPGVKPSISKFPELELIKDMNNLRLYKWNNK